MGDIMLEEKIIEWEKNNSSDDNFVEDINIKILDLMCTIDNDKLEKEFEKVMNKLYFYEEDRSILLLDIADWKKEFKKVQIAKYILNTDNFSDEVKEVIKDINLRDLKRVACTIIPNKNSVDKNSKSLYKRILKSNIIRENIIDSLNKILSSYENASAPVLKLSRH